MTLFGFSLNYHVFLQKKRTSQESILSNLEQYGLQHRYLDVVVMDNARPFWRGVTYVDAIITDRKFYYCLQCAIIYID